MKLENILVFIYETALFLDYSSYNSCEDYGFTYEYGPNVLDYGFVKEINNFFKRLYMENEFELLQSLFNDLTIILESIKNNEDIIDYDNLYKLLSKYLTVDDFVKLQSKCSKIDNAKINYLALFYQDFHYEQLVLTQTKNTGYQKILQ